MFQTEINLFFQAFETPWLTEFFRLMTRLGYTTFLLVFIIFVLFAVDFRRGFILLQILLLTGIITNFLKNFWAYPRPFHIDPQIKFLDTDLSGNEFRLTQTADAQGFMDMLPPETLAQMRAHIGISYGIPSGHTSVAAALWGATALLFQQRWLKAVCIFLIIFVPLSRIYLGVHFLADVLVGYLLGFLLLGIAYQLIIRKNKLQAYLQSQNPLISPQLLIFLVGMPLLGFGLLPRAEWRVPAYMLGMNLAYILLIINGLPKNEGSLLQRFARFVMGVLVFIIADSLAKFVFKTLGFVAEDAFASSFFTIVVSILFMWGGVNLNRFLGLYSQ
jgi:membrane-associated phospholipid phosphatase